MVAPWVAASCRGKHRYQTAAAAHETVARRRNSLRKGQRRRELLKVYRCRACNGWHIGGWMGDRARRLDYEGRREGIGRDEGRRGDD